MADAQLNEISKKTLASYVAGAGDEVKRANMHLSHAGGPLSPSLSSLKRASDYKLKRSRGIELANKKLAKEDVDQLDELSRKTLASYVGKASASYANSHRDYSNDPKLKTARGRRGFSTSGKRARGISRATERLAKEDTDMEDLDLSMFTEEEIADFVRLVELDESGEQLDEISKKTLGSYVKKASLDSAERAYGAGIEDARSNNQAMPSRAERNRDIGISRAVKRLTKEDVDQLDEISKKTLKSYIDKAGASEKRHADGLYRANARGVKAIEAGRPDDLKKSYEKGKYHERKSMNRFKGAWKARDKISGSQFAKVHAKEDVNDLTETSYDADLKDHHPRYVEGVRGAKGTPFRKKFKNAAHMDAWFDKEGDNHTVHSVYRASHNEDTDMEDLDLSMFTEEEIADFVRLIELEESGEQLDEISSEKIRKMAARYQNYASDASKKSRKIKGSSKEDRAAWRKEGEYHDNMAKRARHLAGSNDGRILKKTSVVGSSGHEDGEYKNRYGQAFSKIARKNAKDVLAGGHKLINRLYGGPKAYKEDVNETVAADTLKPGSRVAMASAIADAVKDWTDSDQVDFFKQMLASIGKEASNVPAGASGANQATLAAKKAVREDVADLFKEDGVELTEEFKTKASDLFEAALDLKTKVIAEELEELAEKYIEEEVAAIAEEMIDKVDHFLNYVAEEWMKRNELAVESGLRAEVAESFINGIRGVFEQHYVHVPEGREDILESMAARIEELESELNEVHTVAADLTEENEALAKEVVLSEVSEGLTLVQRDKLRSLTESLEFRDGESFAKSATAVRAKFINEGAKGGMLNEDVSGEEKTRDVAEPMKGYIDVIRGSVKGAA